MAGKLTQALSNPLNTGFVKEHRENVNAERLPAQNIPQDLDPYVQETTALALLSGQPVKHGIYRRSTVPGWILGVDAGARGGITSLTHGFAAFGHIGEQYPVYFSKSSDEKRGRLTIDAGFIKAAQSKKTKACAAFFSDIVLAARKRLPSAVVDAVRDIEINQRLDLCGSQRRSEVARAIPG